LPGLRGTLRTQPPRHSPGHDLHRAAAGAHGRWPAAGNLLLHQHGELGALRSDPVGHLRPLAVDPAGIRLAGIPAPERGGHAGLERVADTAWRTGAAAAGRASDRSDRLIVGWR